MFPKILLDPLFGNFPVDFVLFFQGDSGSPVVMGNYQVGLVSSGMHEFCASGFPDAHTNLYFFKDWIKSVTYKFEKRRNRG